MWIKILSMNYFFLSHVRWIFISDGHSLTMMKLPWSLLHNVSFCYCFDVSSSPPAEMNLIYLMYRSSIEQITTCLKGLCNLCSWQQPQSSGRAAEEGPLSRAGHTCTRCHVYILWRLCDVFLDQNREMTLVNDANIDEIESKQQRDVLHIQWGMMMTFTILLLLCYCYLWQFTQSFNSAWFICLVG